VPTFGRTGAGKWHVVGPDGCRYGQAFTDETETAPDETVTATDIVAYVPPDPPDDTHLSSIAVASSPGRLLPSGRSDEQRLVLPTAVRESTVGLCDSCRSHLKRHQQRRSRLITDLKQVTPLREIDWAVTDHDARQACDWCLAREVTTWHSDTLDSSVCPACGRLFNTPLGDPGAENTPEVDRLPDTPTEPVTPIVIGTTLPDYDPTALVGSHRPLIKCREKEKYATVICDLKRTGHAFTADGIAALDQLRARYAERIADNADHHTAVTLEIGRTPRSVTIEGIFPADSASVIEDCWAIVSDPSNWYPAGWPQQEWMHRRSAEPAIPGEEAVVDAFPRLQTQTQTQTPASSVDTESLRTMTESDRYQRGERYYEAGAVTDLEHVDTLLHATVHGSQPYDVQVTLADGRYVEGQCSCPDDAVPCKHIVAVMLASGDVEATGSDRSIEEVLAAASAEELRTLLSDLAADDLTLRKHIYEELDDS
jgi:hypothetical protein